MPGPDGPDPAGAQLRPGARDDERRVRAARVLAGLRTLWGDELPPGRDPELSWLVDALAIDEALGREDGYVVRGDALTLSTLAQWLTAPPFPEETTAGWQWDTATGRVQFDERGSAVLGVGREAVGVERLLLDVHPRDRAHVQDAVQRVVATGGHLRATFRGRSPAGQWQWRTATGRRVSVRGDGAVLVGFVTVHQEEAARG